MICRKFYLTVESGVGLPNVREIFSTRGYAKVEIGSANGCNLKFKLKPDNRNGLNPVWYQPISCNISDSGIHYYGLTVIIKLYTARTLGDRPIGEVHMMMKDLYDNAYACGGRLSLPIKQGVNQTEGMLNFCYSFDEIFQMPEGHFSTKLNHFSTKLSLVSQIAFKIMVQGISHAILVAVFM